MFDLLFGPKIDPETTVEYWSVTVIQDGENYYANRTLYEKTTWQATQKALKKLFDIPANTFGIQAPMYLLVINYCGKRTHSLLTQADFEKYTGSFPTRTVQEEKEWRDIFIQRLKLSLMESQVKILQGQIKILELTAEMHEIIKSLSKSNPKS